MKFTLENQQKGQELLNNLITQAWESVSFKEQLINNPESTIESVTGEKINIPTNTKLVVEDQTDSSIIYLNIPRKVDFDLDEMELTDEQLDTVSGGDITLGGVLTVIAIASIVYSAGTGIYDAIQDSKK